MKKFLSVILILALLACAVSCNKENTDGKNNSKDGDICASAELHLDENDNGECDTCGESVIVSIDLYAVNDLHGKICDSDTQAGVDELTTYLKRAYDTDDNAILLSSGDMWQGSSESNLTKGNIVTEWMNELDFVSMTLGNHEYDWGEEYIEDNLALAEFPFLAINIYEKQTNERVDYCAPSVTIERDGVTIGIIGAIGDCYSSISSDQTEDVYFVTGDDLTELVKDESERLRAEGADFIVYSLHDGYSGSNYGDTATENMLSPYYDIELSDGYVDLVFEGHTHKYYVKTDAHGVYHLQNGGDNKGISHVEVDINFASGSSYVTEAEYVPSARYAYLEDDEIVEELLEKYAAEVSEGNRVLGENSSSRSGDELKALVAKLYYEKGIERWGEEYNIVLGGGFISVRSPGYLPAGEVRYSDLQMLFPFDNQLVLCSVKSSELRSRFFESDNSNYFIYYEEYGEQVKESIDASKTYYVIVDSYSSTYAPNRLTEIERYDASVFARDLLAAYIESGKLEGN